MSKRERKRLRRWAVRTEQVLYGWYSAEQDKAWGHCLYRRTNGEIIRITTVSRRRRSGTRWPDVRSTGKVLGVKQDGCVLANPTVRIVGMPDYAPSRPFTRLYYT